MDGCLVDRQTGKVPTGIGAQVYLQLTQTLFLGLAERLDEALGHVIPRMALA